MWWSLNWLQLPELNTSFIPQMYLPELDKIKTEINIILKLAFVTELYIYLPLPRRKYLFIQSWSIRNQANKKKDIKGSSRFFPTRFAVLKLTIYNWCCFQTVTRKGTSWWVFEVTMTSINLTLTRSGSHLVHCGILAAHIVLIRKCILTDPISANIRFLY